MEVTDKKPNTGARTGAPLLALMLGAAVPLVAREAPAKAGTAAKPSRIYAQALVERAAARHPDVLLIAMHVTPPNTRDNVIIASSVAGIVGKKSDAGDLEVIEKGQAQVHVGAKGDRLSVGLPLRDVSGNTVGGLAVAFPYKAGDDKTALQRKAEGIRDELGKRISHVANLMDPARFDRETPTDTYAQALLDKTLDRHSEVIILAMHVTPPGRSDNVIIASNIGRIGKKADEDDLGVIQSAKPKLEVNTAGDRFEVELPMHDASGKLIGALGVVFPYKKGDDQAALQKKAEAVRDEIAKQTPTLAKLVGPAR
jgi:hypothetical protein